MIPDHLADGIKAWRPARVVQAFHKDLVSQNLNWLHKLAEHHADHAGGDRMADLDRLRRIVLQQDQQYASKFDIDTMLSHILAVAAAARTGSAPTVAQQSFPSDVLVQLFPGADHPPMPPDLLVDVADRWNPQQAAPLAPLSMVIVKALGAIAYAMALPFTMGAIVGPIDPVAESDLILQWWVPPLAREHVSGGRMRKTVDLFGAWAPHGTVDLEDYDQISMPDATVSKSDVLIGPVDLEDGKLKFDTLDALVDTHGIDITGLQWTRTKLGSVYRSWRLLAR